MDVKERLMKFIAQKGLTNSEFERISGLSNSYVSKIRTSVGKLGSMNIQRAFPELNMNWLLTGEGEMLNPPSDNPTNQSISGHHGTSVAGNGNNVNATSALEKALEGLMEQQKITIKAQEQIDRLLALLEKNNR
jgi:transcriptional regulator with XRE-family HTH domain